MGLSKEDWIFLGVLVFLVMAFMGPGLWSNHSELPVTYLWRRWKNRKKPPAP